MVDTAFLRLNEASRNGSGEERMKIAKGVGLVAGVLTLIYGLYHIRVIWKLGLVTLTQRGALALVLIDTVVYLVLSIGMILDKRRDFFLLTVFWTMVGSVLAVVVVFPYYSYGVASFNPTLNPTLNLLFFLIVFFSTCYYVTKTNAATSRYMELSAGILALVQGVYLLWAFVMGSLWVLVGGGTPVLLILLMPYMVIYLVLGVGIVRGNRKFLLYTVLWTILELALALAIGTYMSYPKKDKLLNLLSILTLFLSTYCYWSKPET